MSVNYVTHIILTYCITGPGDVSNSDSVLQYIREYITITHSTPPLSRCDSSDCFTSIAIDSKFVEQ